MATKIAGSPLGDRGRCRGCVDQAVSGSAVLTIVHAKPLGALGGLLILLLVGMAFLPPYWPPDPIHIKAADRLRLPWCCCC